MSRLSTPGGKTLAGRGARPNKIWRCATFLLDNTLMAFKRNLFIIGPMGAGKTTIGKRLARELKLEFIDLDQAIESHTGASIPLIFDIEGEAGFRRRESDLLRRLVSREGILLATGGGAILAEENRHLLRDNGLVIYLKTPVDEQLRRLKHDRSRPLLQAADRRERLLQMAQQRNPLYEQTADLIIHSSGESAGHMTHKALRLIRTCAPGYLPSKETKHASSGHSPG